jgi:hypothetical protein
MSATASALPDQCLQAPVLAGVQGLRARLIDVVKTVAIRLLHRNRPGELLLLRMYFLAESATVHGIANDVRPMSMPDWLVAVNARHLEEEGVHIKLFSEAIKARGGVLPNARHLDPLSRYKLGQWVAIAQRYRARFAWDGLVPAYAIGLCAEQMALRVLERHRRAILPEHPFYALLDRVWHDEAQHVATCAEVLQKLVGAEEANDLRALLGELRGVDHAWGLTTAIGLLGVACLTACRGRAA